MFFPLWKKQSSSLSPSFHRPSSLISVRLFTRGHRSPTEYLLIASLSSCWSMSCMLWCLRLYAIAAALTLPSSSGQCQRRKANDPVSGRERERECHGYQGCLNKKLKYLQSTSLCLQLLTVSIFGKRAATCNLNAGWVEVLETWQNTPVSSRRYLIMWYSKERGHTQFHSTDNMYFKLDNTTVLIILLFFLLTLKCLCSAFFGKGLTNKEIVPMCPCACYLHYRYTQYIN